MGVRVVKLIPDYPGFVLLALYFSSELLALPDPDDQVCGQLRLALSVRSFLIATGTKIRPIRMKTTPTSNSRDEDEVAVSMRARFQYVSMLKKSCTLASRPNIMLL